MSALTSLGGALRRKIHPAARGAFYYAAFYGAVALFDPFINVHFNNLGLTGQQIGILGALLPLASLLFTPVYSGLADRTGRRVTLLVLTLLAAGVSFALVGSGRTFALLFIFMALFAVARSSTSSLGDGLVARMAVRHDIDFGSMRLGGSIGFAILVAIAGVVWGRVGFAPMFPAVVVGFGVAAFAAALLDETRATNRARELPWEMLRKDSWLRTLLLASLLLGGAFNINLVFNGLYIKHLGGSEALLGIIIGVSAISELPGMRLAGRLIQRFGGVRVLFFGYALLSLSFLGYALSASPWPVLVFSALRGPGVALMMVGTVTTLDRHASEERSATIQALNYAGSFGLAPLIASPLGGWLWDQAGPASVYWASTLLSLLAMIILFLLIRQERY